MEKTVCNLTHLLKEGIINQAERKLYTRVLGINYKTSVVQNILNFSDGNNPHTINFFFLIRKFKTEVQMMQVVNSTSSA